METQYKGNNRLILGIVFGVVTFWLFAQTMVNIVPAIQADLGISRHLGDCHQCDIFIFRYVHGCCRWACG